MVNSIVIGSSVYKDFQPVQNNLKVNVVLNHLWTVDKKKNMSGEAAQIRLYSLIKLTNFLIIKGIFEHFI